MSGDLFTDAIALLSTTALGFAAGLALGMLLRSRELADERDRADALDAALSACAQPYRDHAPLDTEPSR